jgi:hypothetical protein
MLSSTSSGQLRRLWVEVSPVEIEPASDGLTIRGIRSEVIEGGHPSVRDTFQTQVVHHVA